MNVMYRHQDTLCMPIAVNHSQTMSDLKFVHFLDRWEGTIHQTFPVCVICSERAKQCCAPCMVTLYCSQTCQAKDWPLHKCFPSRYVRIDPSLFEAVVMRIDKLGDYKSKAMPALADFPAKATQLDKLRIQTFLDEECAKCAHCGKLSVTHACPKCQSEMYCDATCRKADRLNHQQKCRSVRILRGDHTVGISRRSQQRRFMDAMARHLEDRLLVVRVDSKTQDSTTPTQQTLTTASSDTKTSDSKQTTTVVDLSTPHLIDSVTARQNESFFFMNIHVVLFSSIKHKSIHICSLFRFCQTHQDFAAFF